MKVTEGSADFDAQFEETVLYDREQWWQLHWVSVHNSSEVRNHREMNAGLTLCSLSSVCINSETLQKGQCCEPSKWVFVPQLSLSVIKRSSVCFLGDSKYSKV